MKLDAQYILTNVDGDLGLLAEVVQVFHADLPRLLSDIRSCVGAGDAAGLQRTAHALKGSLGNFGASGAYTTALALERMGREGRPAGAAGRLAELERDVGGLDVALARMVAEVPA